MLLVNVLTQRSEGPKVRSSERSQLQQTAKQVQTEVPVAQLERQAAYHTRWLHNIYCMGQPQQQRGAAMPPALPDVRRRPKDKHRAYCERDSAVVAILTSQRTG